MSGGIYKITNTVNNKFYIGGCKNFKARLARHFKDLGSGVHSSIKFQQDFDMYGKDVFVMSIIETIEYNKSLIKERENFWIEKLKAKENGYNIADAAFGDAISFHPNKGQIIEKRTKAVKSKMALMSSEERKLKYGKPGELNGMYGKNYQCYGLLAHTQNIKGKTFEQVYGTKRAKELKQNLKNSFTPERRHKLSESGKAKTGELNPFYGKTHSAEARSKISKARKGSKNVKCYKPVIVEGVEYPSLKHAAEITKIKATTIWHRCRSKNPKYKTTYLKESPKLQ